MASRKRPTNPTICVHLDAAGNEKHPHGTRVRYTSDRCGCEDCRAAALAYERRLTRIRAYGRPTERDLIDAAPVRAHIQELIEDGATWHQIATAAGVTRSVVWKLLNGEPARGLPPALRVNRKAATAILDVCFADIAAGTRVDPNGTRLRLQALATIGWAQSTLATRLGKDDDFCRRILDGTRHVTRADRDRIRTLYDELWNSPPVTDGTPQSRAWIRRTADAAKRNGWVRPMGLDDDLIDSPGYRPVRLDPPPDPSTKSGKTAPIHVDDVEMLAREGYSLPAVAHRLRRNPQSVERALRRKGRSDLLESLRANLVKLAS